MLPLLLTMTMILQGPGTVGWPNGAGPGTAVVPPLAVSAPAGPGPADIPAAGPYGPASDTGKTLFGHNCSRCHGNDGTKGFFGARNLQISRLSDSAITVQILNGKKFMPSFRKRLSPDEIQSLTQYVKTLRTH